MKSTKLNLKLLTPEQLRQLLTLIQDLRDQAVLDIQAQAGVRRTEAFPVPPALRELGWPGWLGCLR